MTDFNQECSKHGCHTPVYGKPDLSQPAKIYSWIDKSKNKRMTVAHPLKPVSRPAYCYFHRTLPNYPKAEPFKRKE